MLTTPLQMALIAAAIGEDGRRMRPTLRRGERTEGSQATRGARRPLRRPRDARGGDERDGRRGPAPGRGGGGQDRHRGAAVDGQRGPRAGRAGEPPPEDDPTDTDAWFAAYAPAGNPKIAVAVLLIAQGAGGEVAAPAAAQVIDAALG